MKNLFSRFAKDESGATAIEYGLIATLIGVAIIAGATALGGALNRHFQGIADDVTSAAAPASAASNAHQAKALAAAPIGFGAAASLCGSEPVALTLCSATSGQMPTRVEFTQPKTRR